MATSKILLGPIPHARYDWVSGANYGKEAIVFHKGSSYIALSDNPSAEPSFTYDPATGSYNVSAGWGLLAVGAEIVQETGDSQDKAMSQKAVTDALTASDQKLSELEVNTILLLEVTKTVEGKIYNSEDLSTISSPNYRSAVIEVHEGESYVVTCSSNNDVWCGAFVALGNGSLQKILIRHGVYTNELINIPTGGVRLYLNGFGNLMNLDELDAKKVENKIGKTVQKLVSDVEKQENTIERLYTNMSLSFEKIKDCLFKTDKTRYGSAEFPYAKIDVSGINKIQATSDQVSVTANNAAFWVVIFIGENGAILSGKNIIELGGNDVRYFNDAEIEVPVGAKYVLVNGNNVSANGLDVFLPEENKKEISNIKENIGEGQDLLDAIYRASIAPNFKMKALDKAYFSWTNDDALQIHRSYKAICDEFGCPYCPAIIWENFGLPISATNICGEELVQFCNEVINNGGEILSHGVKVLTSASTDADFEEYFKTSQEVFKKNLGVVPRGKIMHGGPNSGTINPAKCQKYYLRYFDFADFMSIKSPMISNQYKLERFISSIGSGTEDEQFNRYKNMIDDAIANKKWVRMWCHNENELSLNVFRRILTYISSKKQEGLADFATWSYMYDNFGDFSY